MLKITRFQSIAISSDGMPSRAMRPPCAMLASMSCSAAGLPDISSPTSKPSVMPSSRCASAIEPRLTSSACVTPIAPGELEPVGVHVGDDDVARAGVAHDGGRHDADRAGARDQDVLAQHGERERRVHGVAVGIEDRGDVQVDAGRVLPDVRHGQRDELGERPRAVDADALRVRAQVAAARHAVAAAAAHEVPLAADDVARREVVHVRADLDDLARELMADDHRHRDGALRPGIPGADVQIGAADARAQHADQHVVDADLGLGRVDQPDARDAPPISRAPSRRRSTPTRAPRP